MKFIRIVVAIMILAISLLGIIWWYATAEQFLGKFNNGCDSPFGPNKANCTYGQFHIYLFPFFFFIGMLGISIATLYSVIKEILV